MPQPSDWSRAMARRTEWDVFATADAPGLDGDSVEFTVLPGRAAGAEVAALAAAVEKQLLPPYRALGRRQEKALWAVAARAIDLRRLAADGDDLEVVVREGEPPPVEGLPQLAGDYLVRGTRLDGDLWEIHVDPI